MRWTRNGGTLVVADGSDAVIPLRRALRTFIAASAPLSQFYLRCPVRMHSPMVDILLTTCLLTTTIIVHPFSFLVFRWHCSPISCIVHMTYNLPPLKRQHPVCNRSNNSATTPPTVSPSYLDSPVSTLKRLTRYSGNKFGAFSLTDNFLDILPEVPS
jgi:hypothetical protein